MSYCLAVGIVAFIYVDVHPDWFLTFGGSAPHGVWYAVDYDNDSPPERGEWVIVCPPLTKAAHRQLFVVDPPNNDACTTRSSLKQIVAKPGDRVFVDHPWIHAPFGSVEAVAIDNLGRPLPRPTNGEHAVDVDTYWVLSPHPRSVDSRYYGPVPSSMIEKTAQPIWIAR